MQTWRFSLRLVGVVLPRGKKARLPAPRKDGADQHYKELTVVANYDETREHRVVAGTRGNHEAVGRIMHREAVRIRFDPPVENVATSTARVWTLTESSGNQSVHVTSAWTSTTSVRTSIKRCVRFTAKTTWGKAAGAPDAA